MDFQRSTEPVSDAQIEAATKTRHGYFDQLMGWYVEDRLTRSQLAEHLLEAWTGAEWPREVAEWHLYHAGRYDGGRGIVTMFRTAGFLTDNPDMPRPKVPMRLYRGCTENGAEGFSWTTDPEVARRFAKRETLFARDPEEYGEPVIIAATIDPEHILAVVTEGRSEFEVIIDPIGAAYAINAGVYLSDLDTPDIPVAAERSLGKWMG